MSDDRDVELGRRLAALPTPDHGHDFWAQLDQRLSEETVDEVTEARARRRGGLARVVPLVAVAAVVAAVLGFVGTRGGDEAADRVDTTPATEPDADDLPQTVAGTVVLAEAGQAEPAQEFTFVRAIDGSYVMRNTATGEAMAYDAPSARSISWFTYDGETSVSRTANVAPGAPDRYAYSFVGAHDLEDFVVAAAREGRDGIDEHEVAGRRALRYRGPVSENKLAGNGVDFIEVSVDRESGVLLRLIEESDGAIGRQLTVTEFSASDSIDRTVFTPEPPTGAVAESEDAGFQRSSLDDLPTSGAIPPLYPSRSEGGEFGPPAAFELDSVWINVEGGGVTGPEGSNPPSKRVTSLVYRDGWRRVVVTLRELGAPPDRWSDPFRGEGQVFDDQDDFELDADGAFAGAEGSIVLDPQTVPHVWAISCGQDCTAANEWPGYVLTVAGAATADEIRQFATVAMAA